MTGSSVPTGGKPDPTRARLASWNASCNTCGVDMFTEEYLADGSTGPYEEADAKDWAEYHYCVRELVVSPPMMPKGDLA